MFRRVLICLAFATWCFLNFWVALAERETPYFLRGNPARTILPKVAGWELGLLLAMLAVWEFGRGRPWLRRWIEVFFLVACIFPFGIVSAALARISHFDVTALIQAPWFWPTALAAAVLAFGFAASRPSAAGAFLRSMFLWSWLPLCVVLGQAGSTMLRYGSNDYRDLPLAPRLPAPNQEVRVVWIIFDELSQTVAFTNRPTGLQLPNLDHLKEESFYATAASSPADATLLSMPTLILGEKVLRAEPNGPADLRIETRGRAGRSSWASANNIFDSARQAGFNTALVGWYHPYGRLLNRSLTDSFWVPTEIEPGAEEGALPGASWLSAMFDRMWLQMATLPLAGHMPRFSPRRYERRMRVHDFEQLRQHALRAVADSSLGVMLIHLPVPHPPGIYDSAKSQLDPASLSGYIENVALADRTLGELRRAMEQSGVWDRTAVVVSADHGWRVNLWRGLPEWTPQEELFAAMNTSGVPFLVKLPHQAEQVVYEKPFDTVVTREVLTAIFTGHVASGRQIPAAIEGARNQAR